VRIGRINDVTGGFNLEMNLMELLTLYSMILLAKEKILADIDSFEFKDSTEVAKILKDFHQKVERQVVDRTPQELQVGFFKS